MEKRLVWKTASDRTASVITLGGRGKNSVILTTVRELQRNGVIKLYWERNGIQEPADVIRVKRLPPNNPGDPVLSLKAVYNGRKNLIFSVQTSGTAIITKKLVVPRKYRPGVSGKLPLIIPAAVLSAAALFFLFWFVLPLPLLRNEDPEKTESFQVQNSTQERSKAETPVKMNQESPLTVSPPSEPEKTETYAPVSPGNPEENEIFLPFESKIYFKPERAELTAAAISELDEISENLQDRDLSGLEITGHCALFGTEEDRLRLSIERARNTFEYINTRLPLPDTVIITGLGGRDPITRAEDEQDLNRRVEITLTP